MERTVHFGAEATRCFEEISINKGYQNIELVATKLQKGTEQKGPKYPCGQQGEDDNASSNINHLLFVLIVHIGSFKKSYSLDPGLGSILSTNRIMNLINERGLWQIKTPLTMNPI